MNLIKPVFGQITNPVLPSTADIGNGQTYFNSVLQTIIEILLLFGVFYFVVHFILAGYHMISSMGDPKKYEESQHALLYSLMGIAIVFLVFAILKIIGTIFGLEGLERLEINWPGL